MKQLLTKAVLVSLTLVTVTGTGGVADAGNRPSPVKKPTTTTTCDVDPTACVSVAKAGIRW